ncbi:MAG: type II secretion system protein [Chloroflexi bacterium]|nr:type II secretion system protein [Chloroflexota bacterium]
MAGSLKKLASRITGGQKGFTLIEMIVVVGIIAVLAAVIVPNIGKFIGTGEDGAKSAEWESVQTAMNAMMAESAVNTVPASSSGSAAIQDWTSVPTAVTNSEQPLGAYLQNPVTVYLYCYDANGQIVTQGEQGGGLTC